MTPCQTKMPQPILSYDDSGVTDAFSVAKAETGGSLQPHGPNGLGLKGFKEMTLQLLSCGWYNHTVATTSYAYESNRNIGIVRIRPPVAVFSALDTIGYQSARFPRTHPKLHDAMHDGVRNTTQKERSRTSFTAGPVPALRSGPITLRRLWRPPIYFPPFCQPLSQIVGIPLLHYQNSLPCIWSLIPCDPSIRQKYHNAARNAHFNIRFETFLFHDLRKLSPPP
ncbi:uncharacterized protein BDR25DRAFT_354238 [Lindgomyces ingoldianus]|uniref:Uncharacterized protein n=1 Tax=Lindgomyces ingoldianus TaxID=673940 RepID=A0ACB6QYY4_9PLEO|nr:uncharacterized protein BDR25DRAFT_354238 [Lindgomyces ingoldianus]KAF2471745.1 hypothetical protein BDR25DRAFT_354238 [Lindgomyces ingoldianus]